MKRLLIILLFVSCLGIAQNSTGKLLWETDFDLAKKKARKEGKPILMLFTGSDWCPPCKKLKADFFDSQKFKDKSHNFVLLMVDLPKNIELIGKEQYESNKQLHKKYGIGSIPVIIVTNSSGGIIDKIKNYNAARDTSEHFKFIDDLLR